MLWQNRNSEIAIIDLENAEQFFFPNVIWAVVIKARGIMKIPRHSCVQFIVVVIKQ